MKPSPEFPNDLNGDVLRRMYVGGDDLARPRMINFSFVFPERRKALSFAQIIDDRDKEICIAYYEEREMWEVTVKHHLVPDYREVTAMESALALKAESVGGKADGWNCLRISQNQT
jgi:hypothetical protein